MRALVLLLFSAILAGCQSAPAPHVADSPPAPDVTADPGTPEFRLGIARGRIAVAEVDGVVYLFGGTTGRESLSLIEALDTADLRVKPIDASLPGPRDSVSAVAHDGRIYLFGGVTGDRGTPSEVFFDDILVFDPEVGTIEPLAARLPTPRANMGAFTDGERIYLVGGDGIARSRGVSNLADIVIFDPRALTVEVDALALPFARNTPAAAWDGNAALILGGNVDAFTNVRDVVEYTPGRGVATLSVRLPVPSAGGAAVWLEERGCAVLVGAHDGREPIQTPFCASGGNMGRVQTFDELPTEPRYHAGVALVNEYVYLIGGFNADREPLDVISAFDL